MHALSFLSAAARAEGLRQFPDPARSIQIAMSTPSWLLRTNFKGPNTIDDFRAGWEAAGNAHKILGRAVSSAIRSISVSENVTLEKLRALKAGGRKFAMLTAYDFPTAAAAQAAGIHALLVGDSLGSVVLGQPNTRAVTLDLMIPLAEAVRRAAPYVFLVGDVPFECMS